jgi:antitoxin VapB
MDVAKLFKNGQSQAVRLPKAYRFKGNEVYVKRVGSAVVLLPEKNSWEPLLSSLEEFTDDFMQERNQPRGQDKRTKSWD